MDAATVQNLECFAQRAGDGRNFAARFTLSCDPPDPFPDKQEIRAGLEKKKKRKKTRKFKQTPEERRGGNSGVGQNGGECSQRLFQEEE